MLLRSSAAEAVSSSSTRTATTGVRVLLESSVPRVLLSVARVLQSVVAAAAAAAAAAAEC